MDVLRFHDPSAFAAAATPLLMQREAENCFFLGLCESLTNPTDVMLFVVRSSDGPVAVATMTPGRHMMMTDSPPDAIEALAEHLHREQIALPGIQGPRRAIELFATHWTRLTGKTAQRGMETAIHQLTRGIPPASPPSGGMRFARPDDIDLVTEMIESFRVEIGETHPESTREVAADRIAEGALVFWQTDGQPVSMAGFKGRTPNGIRVILVYTPPALRGHGYASSLVAALSQHLLDSGRKFCFLYTDLANPTSNKIYRDVGYEHVADSIRIHFC